MTHAHRYIAERKLPDKAIDLVDEAAARVRMVQESKPEGVSDLEREVRRMQMELAHLHPLTSPYTTTIPLYPLTLLHPLRCAACRWS